MEHMADLLHSEFIYTEAPYPGCHASTLAETPSGLVAAWFGGTDEGANDVGIWLALHRAGAWATPYEVARDDTHPCWNPVLHVGPDGTLHLFYKVGPSPRSWWGLWMQSHDNGHTWSKAIRLPDDILGPIRNKPITLTDGTLLCGSSWERDRRDWTVHMERLSPDGRWQRTEPLNTPDVFAAIQPTLLRYPNGHIQSLCRSQQGVITECWSQDDGYTWSVMQATTLPNPDSGIDGVVLHDGHALLVYNPTVRTHLGDNRHKLHVARSSDGAQWSDILVLEDQPGEFSYPAIIQTNDGQVHITYTWQRTRIKHVTIANPN